MGRHFRFIGHTRARISGNTMELPTNAARVQTQTE